MLLEHTNLDILTVSETHFANDINNEEINIDGYQILRRDRTQKAGDGVAIYFKTTLDCVCFSKYDNNNLGAIWIELNSHSQRLLIGCVYRAPDVSTFFDKLKQVLDKAGMTRKNVVIAGDFNSDLLNQNGNGMKLTCILQSFNFCNIIRKPTRTSQHSNNMIDLILTNNS